MSSSHGSYENCGKDGESKSMTFNHKTHRRHKRHVMDHKTAPQPERKAPITRNVAYDPARFLREMDEETRRKFKILYPRRLYDDTTRHRMIVSGELARDDFRGFDNPREGVFFLDEQGSRMIYGRGTLILF
jgi:hypothetical protein